MAIEYQITIEDLAPEDVDPFSGDTSIPIPTPPAGNGWRLINTTLSLNKIYFTWCRGDNIITVTTTYNILTTDKIILCDATTAAFTVTLPSPSEDLVFTIKKIDSTANIVTIATAGAETIDGSATQDITIQFTALKLVNDGSNWFIV